MHLSHRIAEVWGDEAAKTNLRRTAAENATLHLSDIDELSSKRLQLFNRPEGLHYTTSFCPREGCGAPQVDVDGFKRCEKKKCQLRVRNPTSMWYVTKGGIYIPVITTSIETDMFVDQYLLGT